jgi:ATP-dependent DNA helicase PIF1
LDFNLPQPTGIRIEQHPFFADQEKKDADHLFSTLNPQQIMAFNKVLRAIDSDDIPERYFFLDGPGGSGKTYLYNTLMSFIRGRGEIVLPYATTGIAATLLKGGRTVHSGFKLPVPLEETSVSSMKQTFAEAEIIRQAKLIIIDEVTMLPKHGLRCIDLLLKDLMKTNRPFGGKVIVIGGDFRQTLPVVPRGKEIDIIETCIKSSDLWQHFFQLSLITNMRSEGQDDFNRWLLDVGIGAVQPITGTPQDTIEIPSQMIIHDDIIGAIFTENLASLTLDELSQRVILCPKNAEALDLNNEIIRKLPGKSHIYYSADVVVSDDPSDERNYPAEFLHTLTFSGMPPHQLTLKKGSIVMLLRNLNPKKGLCNGTRLVVKECHRNLITAEVLSESNKGDIVTIPRIDFQPSDVNLPFKLKRRQFPLIPAFSITINKSQGQTFDHVGLFLSEPVFSHGQLYVALSRSRNRQNIKVLIKKTDCQGHLLNDARIFTRNVTYNQAFK